jgi:hypothetical protein
MMISTEQIGTSGRAATGADLAKRWQRVLIEALGKWAGIDANALCASKYHCRPVELSRASADELIAHMKTLRPPALETV